MSGKCLKFWGGRSNALHNNTKVVHWICSACAFVFTWCWSIEKTRESPPPKYIYIYIYASLTMLKPLIVWISANCGKFLKRWKYQITWPASWETFMQVKKQHLEQDMKQQTGSKSGKEYIKGVYCHLVYLTCIQSTSLEMLGWMKHKLESRFCQEKYQ